MSAILCTGEIGYVLASTRIPFSDDSIMRIPIMWNDFIVKFSLDSAGIHRHGFKKGHQCSWETLIKSEKNSQTACLSLLPCRPLLSWAGQVCQLLPYPLFDDPDLLLLWRPSRKMIQVLGVLRALERFDEISRRKNGDTASLELS